MSSAVWPTNWGTTLQEHVEDVEKLWLEGLRTPYDLGPWYLFWGNVLWNNVMRKCPNATGPAYRFFVGAQDILKGHFIDADSTCEVLSCHCARRPS